MYAGIKDKTLSTTLTKSSSMSSEIKLFISYVWDDSTNKFVRKLQKDLACFGFTVFLDKVVIVAGDNIQHELAKEMDQADGIIVLISKKFSSSQWCDKELQMCQRRGKPLFPVRRIKEQPNNNVDMAVGSIKYVDFIEYEDSLKSLVQGIIKK